MKYILKLVLFILGYDRNRFLYRVFSNFQSENSYEWRNIILKSLGSKIGDGVNISPFVVILYPENLKIGDNTKIHEFSVLECKGGLEIGSRCSFAHKLSILTSTHVIKDKNISFRKQGLESKKVSIGNDCWFGAGVVVSFGVNIGDKIIVGANSFVNKNFSVSGTIAGCPAKFI